MTRRAAVGLGVGAAMLAASAGALAAFSGDGFETTNFGGVDSPRGIALQEDSRIVVAGSTTAGASVFDFAVARFEKDGDIDNSFSGNGQQTTEFGDFDIADDVALQDSGQIIAVGSTDADGEADFALAGYTTGGAPDSTFSNDGLQTTDFSESARAHALAIQPNGRIVVAGGKGDDFAVARYRKNGHLDDSFSKDGKTTTNLGGFESAEALAIQPNGRIVVAGSTCLGGGMCTANNFALARYRENGRLDRAFSSDGKVTANLGGSDRALDVALQNDGRIVAAGVADPNSEGGDFAVARFKADGRLDKSFSGDGRRRTDFADNDLAEALAIQRNDRIVLVGSTQDANVDVALARYKKDGSLDDSFSGNGKQTTAFGASGETAEDVAFQTRRKFVITGGILPAQDFLVARYGEDGELDD